jgi:molybdate transport system ATP-binding protein
VKLEALLRKQFRGFRFEVEFQTPVRRLGVFGPSGSGKSTLLNLIAGLLPPDEGFLALDGQTLYNHEEKVQLPPEKRRIAVVFQHSHLFPHLTVRENLLYGYRRCDPADRKIGLPVIVEALKLGHFLDRNARNLSGGERQRVATGRALLANPRLLLLDEPLGGLEESLKFQIMGYLNRVFTEFSVPFIFVSHSLIEMRLMADFVLVLERGRLVEQTTPEQLTLRTMGEERNGYTNLLRLGPARKVNGLFAYQWGAGELRLSTRGPEGESLYELSSRDIILFKKHPEAISARNLLQCRVERIFDIGNKVGVELSFGAEKLITEVMQETAIELAIQPGVLIYAAIKASAFRILK